MWGLRHRTHAGRARRHGRGLSATGEAAVRRQAPV